jgi:uncharacterized membrane protein YkoI
MNRARGWIVTGAAAVGAMIGAAGIAAAAANSQQSATPSSAPSAGSYSGPQAGAPGGRDPATVAHGPGETLLTGTTAEKVRAAALAAVPGGTVIRVETDSDGSKYEAHMRKSDGTEVTVKVDANFKATATEQGFGGGPGGHH